MHNNSIKAYREEFPKLSQRASDIYFFLLEHMEVGFTDRDIKYHMKFGEMNNVRPRVTELIQQGLLEEVGKTTCKVTGKTVRMVSLRNIKAIHVDEYYGEGGINDSNKC